MPRSETTPRSVRLKLACSRCQKRKIKCDGELPTCKNCRNAGAHCTDGVSARLKDLPRAHIAGLRKRIAWLESIVRERCPDVELSYDMDDQDIDDSVIEQEEQATQVSVTASNEERPRMTGQLSTSNPSHEIGLLSLGITQDARYIGPSSGYFLARVMLSKRPIQSESRVEHLPSELVEAVQGPLPLPPRTLAIRLCEAYFESLHPQFPLLHEPSTMKLVDQLYLQPSDVTYVSHFQVHMVLALGAVVLSSRGSRLPAESYCLSALKYFDKINMEDSVPGLQCLLLLLIFALHNPAVRFNAWYLNYQCIAAVLDLGLQRDVTTASGITVLEQEMRTRIFWVVMMLDRTVCTMMGRPIGIRDEACELRLPQGLDDYEMMGETSPHSNAMAYSVHLFRATKLNSEIKYIANSVSQNAPRYAFPIFTDILEWQKDMLTKLDLWADGIPSSSPRLSIICCLRHHNLRMLLLRPSPGIPKPPLEALSKCHESARETIQLFDTLYRNNWLVHNWISLHGLVLATLTMLYCIKVEVSIAQTTQSDELLKDMSMALSVLSATGEHCPGAKRCRDILDDLGKSTVQWLQRPGRQTQALTSTQTRSRRRDTQIFSETAVTAEGPFMAGQTGADTLFDPTDFLQHLPFSNDIDSANIESIMQNLFQDFIPTYP